MEPARGTARPDPTLDAAERSLQLRALIQLGKQRGYLTHADISDHLQKTSPTPRRWRAS